MKSSEIFKDDASVQQFFDKVFDNQTDVSRMMNERVIWRNILYYCIAEGTLVPLLNGTTVPIESLAGKTSWVYGFDLGRLRIVPAIMKNCWQTGEKECVEVALDNGESFICTADHRILTWFGYEEAGSLKTGTPLVPFMGKYFKQTGAYGGYNQVFQPYDAEWQQTHRMVADYIYLDYDRTNVIHHIDENKLNNDPINLQPMSNRQHATLTLEKHKDKIMEGMTKYARSDEGRARKKDSATRQWRDKREEMLISVRKSLSESKEKRIVAIKAFWADKKRCASETERRLGNKWASKGAEINCRVVSVESVGRRKVYDASIPATNNFAINSGVFVHNCGEQYLEYLKSSGSFRRRVIPDYMPTPVSNEIREFVRSTKALLMNQKMIPRVWPNTNEREDKEAADLGENLLTWMDQSHDGDFFDEIEKISIWLCLSGTGFLRAFPDAGGGQWVSDGEEIWKTGDVGTSCLIPFNVRLDPAGDKLKKKRWVGVMSLEDPEWVEDTFNVKIELKGEDRTFLDYQKRLTKLVANVSPWKGHSLDTNTLDTEDENVVLFRELEFAPTAKHMNGQYFISCGGKIIYQRDRMPIKSTPEEWYYSITDFHYNYVPGRFWSDAAVNDLISPQNTINEIDQALAINRKGMARPLVFLPGDVGLKRVEMGGHGFNLLSYNPIMGQKPIVENGTPLPAQVLEERKFQKEQMQDSGGDPKNVLRGSAPSAQSSGVQLDMLRETVERGKAPDIDRYNRALTKVYKKRLLLAQEIYKENRILKITGRGNKVKIKKFKSADLRGNTDVRLELDSGLIATKSGQTQVLLSMIQSGFFGDVQQRPEIQEELFRRFGMASFSEDENPDVNRAEKENMDMSSGERPTVQLVEMVPDPQDPTAAPTPEIMVEDPLFKYDDHVIHSKEHLRFALSDEFKELPQQQRVIILGHIDAHRMEIDNVKPDMRQFIQIDKMYPLMTRAEQMQVLVEIGITPDAEGEVAGLPDASKTMQGKQHLMDTQAREANKAEAIKTDRLKIVADTAVKMEGLEKNAVQDKANSGRRG